jgi:CRISPR-associated protein Csm4
VQTYQITIEPLSLFGTPIKGDTLFGQFCWQTAYDPDLLSYSLDEAVRSYSERPFAVFSSAFPALPDGGVALKRPDAPLEYFFDFSGMAKEDRIGKRKEHKKQKWLVCDKPGAMADLTACRYMQDSDLSDSNPDHLQSHNSINRLTGTTGEGFAPFSQSVTLYPPGSCLVIFVGVENELLSRESLRIGLERIGTSGFGRDASTGMGKFRITACQEVDLASFGSEQPNALYTLAPCVPESGIYRDALFTPFTRFGRHGDRLAISGKPFKNPVIMADEGALLFPVDMAASLERKYIGTSLTGLSKIQATAVAQGYSLYIPLRLEVN